MKIHPKEIRVDKGEEVDLAKWPTRAKPVYKSKEDYDTFLAQHVDKLSSLQHKLTLPTDMRSSLFSKL